MSFDSLLREEARYIILRALHEEASYSLSDALLERVAETYGIRRGREFVRAEMDHLATIGAVKVETAGTAKIATLLPRGRDHVERRMVLEGVKRPSPEA